MARFGHFARRVLRRNRNTSVISAAARPVRFESLEDRRLMSLTMILRDASGNDSATVTSVGQVINLDILAVISNSSGVTSGDSLISVAGSVVGTGKTAAAVDGSITSANYGMFQAAGSHAGTQQDLNNDGNLDSGSTNTSSIAQYFNARAASAQSVGTASGGSLTIKVGTATYTVTSLDHGVETDLNFVPRPPSNAYLTAIWNQDDGPQANDTATYAGGTPFKITNSSLVTPPVAADDTVAAFRNNPKPIFVLENDTEVEPYNLSSLSVVSGPSHGTAVVGTSAGSEVFTYTPSGGYTGPDSFTYHIADIDGRVSNTATVSINVTVPPAPTAVADAATTLRVTPVTIPVLANDTTDVNYATAAVAVSTAPGHGTTQVNADNTITYTPAAGFVGTDTFAYTATNDDGGTSTPATVTVTVTRPAPPDAEPDSSTVVEGATKLVDVLANDHATVGTLQPTSVTVVTAPAHGTAVVQASGQVLYSPTAGYTGADSFTYTVANELGDVSDPATVSLGVVPGSAPNGVADAASGPQNVAIPIDATGNDVATDGGLDPNTLVVASNGSHGTVTILPGGSVINGGATTHNELLYTPEQTFFGTDTFTYTVGDGYGNQSGPVTVTVTISEAAAPTAKTPVAQTLAGANVGINPADGVDTTIPLQSTSTSVTVSAVNGTAALQTDGSILYTPRAGFVGTDTFGYTVIDINGNASPTVTQTVNIGTALSSAKGAPRTLTFTNANGGKSTVSINLGNANVYFTGAGTVTTLRGKTVVTGTSMQIGSIVLTGTTARSNLSIRGPKNAPVVVGGVTDANALGTFSGPTTLLTGTSNFGGLASLQTASFNSASITIGGSAGRTSINVGAAADSNLTSAVQVRSFRSGAWTATASSDTSTTTGVIIAPSILSLTTTGGFGGKLTASSAGSLVFRGLTGTVTVGNVSTFRVIGDATAATVNLTGTTNLFAVTGTLRNSNVTATGNINSVVLGLMNGSNITDGVVPSTPSAPTFVLGTTHLDLSAAALGSAVIRSFVITSRATGGIQNSSVYAGTIRSASVGLIAVNNGGTPQGLETNHISSFTGVYNGRRLILGPKQLSSEAVLTAYLTSKGYNFGDFKIAIPTT